MQGEVCFDNETLKGIKVNGMKSSRRWKGQKIKKKDSSETHYTCHFN